MSDFNKSYRIRTKIGEDTSIHVKLDRDYDILEIMSLKIDQINSYKLHTSEYGVIAGRVLANEAFGIPNAKVSVFINIDNNDINDVIKAVLYPYNTTLSKDKNGVRYNLLPNEQLTNCHTVIGTFPEKQYMLDNNSVLEVFDKYYKFTTRTNNAGDYMIFGVPVGTQTLHVDIDLSDIGILSQKPRDMVYKGYNIEQFENANKFKESTNLESLTQVISQDNVTDVIPFWGDEEEGTIGITRCDINIQYKFEPTCVFMGSVVSDTASNGISKKCIPTPGMGAMDEITTGSGTIEMIRKTPSGQVEEFQIKGTQLINGDGVWCYQIPMNLDYMMTDEFGNMVPTNEPDKGIPTRTRVRFRISMQDFDSDSINMFRCKMLVPHNPDIYSDNCEDELDYNYGSATKESSYRDLFWNCVYSVKSYIPRIQKGSNWKNEKFTGFKRVNYYNDKNPIPYNNIRIRIPFMYRVLCTIINSFIWLISLLNKAFYLISPVLAPANQKYPNEDDNDIVNTQRFTFISLTGELCDENLDKLCIIPGIDMREFTHEYAIGSNDGSVINKPIKSNSKRTLLGYAFLKFYYDNIDDDGRLEKFIGKGKKSRDEHSINETNRNVGNPTDELHYEEKDDAEDKKVYHIELPEIMVTDKVEHFIECIEMNLANEYKVIQFDFYNDWINGLIYIPRWMRKIKKKRTFLGIEVGGKIKACNKSFNSSSINIVQQCGVKYCLNNDIRLNSIGTKIGCVDGKNQNRCHKSSEVRLEETIFKKGGVVHTHKTNKDQFVYYFKPYDGDSGKNIRLFSTDIILLGTFNDCDKWGIPNSLNNLVSSTYQMPPNLALTDSLLEGKGYTNAKTDGNKHVLMDINEKHNRITNLDLGIRHVSGTTEVKYDDLTTIKHWGRYAGISPNVETGVYTELSGINWNYNGPLQNAISGTDPNDLYKPGGHFLGITCHNSTTTIKTCVNLSRICEYGVFMSQRQELDIPETGQTGDFKKVSTIPTGIISGNEITDNEYRRVFATLNSRRLISNNKGVYDFQYINPTNFGGELYDYIFKPGTNESIQNDLYKNLNCLVWKGTYEYTYEVNDDDFVNLERNEKNETQMENVWVNDRLVRLTNEYFDKEYYKFRYGFDDDTVGKYNERKKRFLIVDNEYGSFPMYNNSFYFYFGLHDGRTALDEFKRTYYAVCEKHEMIKRNVSENDVTWSNLKVIRTGVCDSVHTGQIEFDINVSGELLVENSVNVYLLNSSNEIVSSKTISNEGKTTVIFNNLEEGNYKIVIKDSDNLIEKEFNLSLSKVRFFVDDDFISSVDFKEDMTNIPINDIYEYNKTDTYGGYISLKELGFKYENEKGEIENIKLSDKLHLIELKCNKFAEVDNPWNDFNAFVIRMDTNNEGNIIWDGNIDNNEYYGINSEVPKYNDEVRVPVPYSDVEYEVILHIDLNNDCKLEEKKKNDHSKRYELPLGKFTIKNGVGYDILYNGVSYKKLHLSNHNTVDGYIKDVEGWWSDENDNPLWTEESNSIQWKVKENLYKNTLDEIHSVKLEVVGGQTPYTHYLFGNKENEYEYNSVELEMSDIEKVIYPTIDNGTKTERSNFRFAVTDSRNETLPIPTKEPYFFFPVIYKPFYIEMGLWYFSDIDKYFVGGKIYNGKTWDYENEGFNVVKINDKKIVDKIDIEHHDITVNRKVHFTKKIEEIEDIIDSNIKIEIGSSHNEDGTLYEDITSISKNNINVFYKFQEKSFEKDGIKYVKMEIINLEGNNTPPDNIYIINKDEYEYPLNENNELDVRYGNRSTLFDKLMNNELTSGIQTHVIDNQEGYIKIEDYQDKEIYYIAIFNDGETIETTNVKNKIKSISVSKILNLGEML